MRGEVFLGLDGEMTGNKSPANYQLIQIGVFLPRNLYSGSSPDLRTQLFVSDVGYETWNEMEEAMEVNGFTADRIRAGKRPEDVDQDLVVWLEDWGIERKKAVPIGWNVGSFDMPYVRYYLPESSKYFSYRTVDLNSVCFTLARASHFSWTALKSASKRHAEDVMGKGTMPRRTGIVGESVSWHDAGYDAEASYVAWDYLSSLITLREIHEHL